MLARRLSLSLLLVASFSAKASAQFFGPRASGLAAPTSTINFSGTGLANDDLLNGSIPGVTFSNMRLSTTKYMGDGETAANFYPCCTAQFGFTFAGAVSSVAFQYVSLTTQTTFSAYLGGSLVETVTLGTNNAGVLTTDVSWFGFENVLLDRVDISLSPNTSSALDNLQFVTNVVPEPSSIALMGVGLFGLAVAMRRRSHRIG